MKAALAALFTALSLGFVVCLVIGSGYAVGLFFATVFRVLVGVLS